MGAGRKPAEFRNKCVELAPGVVRAPGAFPLEMPFVDRRASRTRPKRPGPAEDQLLLGWIMILGGSVAPPDMARSSSGVRVTVSDFFCFSDSVLVSFGSRF